jgi:transcriptional regulator with XRE-family HTH domain
MFNGWLLKKLQEMNWKQADLARHSGITRAAISNYINGRVPDETALNKIAKAFKIPPEIVFRAAGLLPPQNETSELIEEITHITQGLSSQDQEDILEFAKLRKNLAEKRKNEARKTTRHSTVAK